MDLRRKESKTAGPWPHEPPWPVASLLSWSFPRVRALRGRPGLGGVRTCACRHCCLNQELDNHPHSQLQYVSNKRVPSRFHYVPAAGLQGQGLAQHFLSRTPASLQATMRRARAIVWLFLKLFLCFLLAALGVQPVYRHRAEKEASVAGHSSHEQSTVNSHNYNSWNFWIIT